MWARTSPFQRSPEGANASRLSLVSAVQPLARGCENCHFLQVTEEFSYRAEAAAGYDPAFSHVSNCFVPFLLRAAQLGSGQNVCRVLEEPSWQQSSPSMSSGNHVGAGREWHATGSALTSL